MRLLPAPKGRKMHVIRQRSCGAYQASRWPGFAFVAALLQPRPQGKILPWVSGLRTARGMQSGTKVTGPRWRARNSARQRTRAPDAHRRPAAGGAFHHDPSHEPWQPCAARCRRNRADPAGHIGDRHALDLAGFVPLTAGATGWCPFQALRTVLVKRGGAICA